MKWPLLILIENQFVGYVRLQAGRGNQEVPHRRKIYWIPLLVFARGGKLTTV
jgi:hypothetical protein